MWEGETGYKGYAKIFDVEKGAFVNNILITENSGDAVHICGGNITVKDSESVRVYNANGEELAKLSTYAQMGAGVISDYLSGSYRVLDENGQELFVSNKTVRPVKGSHGYLVRLDGDDSTILDSSGSEVLHLTGMSVSSEHNHIFLVRNKQNSKYGLIHRDGTQILPAEYYDSVNPIENGLFYACDFEDSSEEKYALIGDRGVIATGLSHPGSMNFSKDRKVFVLKDADFTLALEEDFYSYLDAGLIAPRMGENKLYGVFDTYTGKQLLDCEYQDIVAAGEYLYAYKNGSWEVYSYFLEDEITG